MQQLKFLIQPGSYSLCRLDASEEIPGWVYQSAFYTISKSAHELSVICETKFVPHGIKRNDDWRLLKIDAFLDLSLTGITAKFSAPLAAAGVNLCVIATFDTDYLMVKEEKLEIAINVLKQAGFIINL